MEDQGKRLLLAVVVAFALMMAWQWLFPADNTPEKPPAKDESSEVAQPAPAQEGESGGREPTLASPTGQQPGQAPTELAPAPLERGPEQLITLEFNEFRAVFTSYGGNLKSWELKGDKYKVGSNDKARQLDMVPASTSDDQLPFAVRFADMKWPEKTEWRGEQLSNNKVRFTWSYLVASPDGNRVPAFEIIKTYEIVPSEYRVRLAIDVVNKASSDEKQALTVSLYGYQDPAVKTESSMFSQTVDMSWKAACYVGDELDTATVGKLAGANMQRSGDVHWGGFLQSYFLVAASPALETQAPMSCIANAVPGQVGLMRTDIVFPTTNMRVGGPPTTFVVHAFLGPKYLNTLEAIAGSIGYDPGFSASVDLGWFGFLARPMLWLLQWFYSFLGNWGLAIVFLTVLVKLATLYWTTKSMRSMKAMAKLKPQIEVLQKKYKDDRQRQQVELMNLYKAHNINPLAGCLPMLLQMPVWFALYQMLSAAAELYNAPLIPGWISDLTAPDPYYILPVALMVMMFLQAKLSPTTADSTQQKIMMYGLPLMFGVFSFFFPAGLTLYIFTNTVLTAAHNLWMNRTDPPAGKPSSAQPAKAEPGSGKSESAKKPRQEQKQPAPALAEDAAGDAPEDDDSTGADAAESEQSKAGTNTGNRQPRPHAAKKRGGKHKRGSGGKN